MTAAAEGGRFERWMARHPALRRNLSLAMFVTGFVWDSVTLNRIDHLLDNLVLLAYLAVLAGMIVLVLRAQAGALASERLRGFARHYRFILQFFLGGLLAKYVVFYFKSASWTRTSVFLALLVVLLIGNQFFDHRLDNPNLLAVLFFFCLLSFLAFFLPVITSRIDPALFIASGLVSLALSLALFAAAPGPVFRKAAICIAVTYAIVNSLYFANLIPPVPLALQSAGIFHGVKRVGEGYEVEHVPAPWYRFWRRWDDPFLLAAGESAYCYSAIFAPRGIRVPVRHRWSRWDARSGWVETDTIRFEVVGGREGGFRGFTRKNLVDPGPWRVELETERGQILGRVDFRIMRVESHAPLERRQIP